MLTLRISTIAMHHFLEAMTHIEPSLRRGPDILHMEDSSLKWDDVGGIESVKTKLKQLLEWPSTRANQLKKLGLSYPKGILLYGPPGCSKTTIVKILAADSSFTFLSLNGASLYSPYIGESEAAVRKLFARARMAAPSIIFIDEIDAIVVNRANSSSGQPSSGERVLSTLLNEMDGVEQVKNVIVVVSCL